MKITLIGAGSAQFGYCTMGEIFQSSVLKGAEVALVDINQQALDAVYKTGLDFIKDTGLDFKLSAATDRKEALKGSDFVIISIEVGDRFSLWDQDWKIPLQFGIDQVYGENGGPGGIFHALRIIPPILEICDDVVQICPNAVVFNYSNPMSAITTTVLRKHSELKFVGLCHEIASLKRYLPIMLNTPLDNIQYRAAGLNHFSVLLEASYRDSGRDAYPEILQKAPAFFEKEPGFSEVWEYYKRTGLVPHTEGATDSWDIDTKESFRPWSDRHFFKTILETYGLLPITGDSHLGEYVAWASDTADHRGILDFYTFYREALCKESWGKIELQLHERVVPIMEGISTDAGYEEAAVNVLNNGAIPHFPDNVAVEVPAIINRNGVQAHRFKSYPKGFGALIRSYAGVYDLVAEAVLNRSKNLVMQAILSCPMVNRYHGMSDMLDMVIDEQRRWLGYLQ